MKVVKKELLITRARRFLGGNNFEKMKKFYLERSCLGKFIWRQDYKTKEYFAVLETCNYFKKKELELHYGEFLIWEDGDFSIEKEYNDRIKEIWENEERLLKGADIDER